jgi:heme exporter protein D
MSWNSLSEFLHMGGYGLYVWASFGVTALLVAGEIALLAQRRRRALNLVRRTVKFDKVKNDDDESAA